MQVARRNDLDPYIRQAVALVGPYAWRQLVREARQAGQDFRGAVENALYRVRDHPIDRVGRSSKRDRSGNAKVEPPSSVVGDYISMSDNVNFSRSSMRIGRTRKRTANDVWKAHIGGMREHIYRWQNVSDSLLGPGAFPIGFGHPAPNVSYPELQSSWVLPFHMMSLTTCPALSVNGELGCRNTGMARTVYRGPGTTGQGDIGYGFLPSEIADGTQNNAYPWMNSWVDEKGTPAGGYTLPVMTEIFHKYTDIRLNLYGSLSYPLTYNVMVVTGLPREMSMFETAPVDGLFNTYPADQFGVKNANPFNEFVVDHVRPLLTNPIKGSNSFKTYKGKYKVLRQRTVHVPCLTYGDAAVTSDVVQSTNVKNLNIFLRHDRFRDYGWHARSTDETKAYDISKNGWTKTDTSLSATSSLYCDVDREERIYLIITCTAARKVESDVYNMLVTPVLPTTPALVTEGSYDIVVRNCFRYSTDLV